MHIEGGRPLTRGRACSQDQRSVWVYSVLYADYQGDEMTIGFVTNDVDFTQDLRTQLELNPGEDFSEWYVHIDWDIDHPLKTATMTMHGYVPGGLRFLSGEVAAMLHTVARGLDRDGYRARVELVGK